jgi:Skp family chaperone for outer membrane proteins
MLSVGNGLAVGLSIAIAITGSQFLSRTAAAQVGPKVIEKVLKPAPLNKDEDKTVAERHKKEYEKKVEETRKKQAEIHEKEEKKKDAVDKKWKQIENSPYTPKKKEEIMNKFIKDYDAKNKN